MWRWLVVGLFAIALAARLALWARPLGFLTGDDVEMLLTGFAPVTGLEYSPWNIRSLFLPLVLITPVVWGAVNLGIEDPDALVRLAEAPFVIFSLLNIAFVYCLALRFSPRENRYLMPLVAAGIYAFHWLPLAFAATPYPRTIATTCVIGAALLLLLDPKNEVKNGLGAGVLLALAFAARFSEVVFLFPLLLLRPDWDASHHSSSRWRRVWPTILGLAIGVTVTIGLFDLATWGKPFASLFEFARYTLIEKRSSSLVAEQGVFFYLSRAGFWAIPPLLPFLFTKYSSRERQLWLPVILPLIMLSAVHHKEMRYLQALIPFYAVLLSIGATRWLTGVRWRRLVAAVLLVLGLGMSLRTAVGVHQRSSMSAVAVARDLAADPSIHGVVLTQAWAYGLHLFLDSRMEIRNFDRAPEVEQLERALSGVDAVATYEDDLEREPALRRVLEISGFREARRVQRGASRAVVLFRRTSPELAGS